MSNKGTIFMDYDTWEEEYQPLIDNEGSIMRIEPQDWDKMKTVVPEVVESLRPFLWTEYDNDNLCSGEHFVNRLYFQLTLKSTPKDKDIIVPYPSLQYDGDTDEIDVIYLYSPIDGVTTDE